MADDNSGGNSAMGVVLGALLVVVLGIGAFMFLGNHNTAPSAPSVNVTMPKAPVPGK